MHSISPKRLFLGCVLGVLATQTSASGGGYMCPTTASSSDAAALEFAYAVQDFLYQFYEQNGNYSASDFSGFPNASTTTMNGEMLSQDIATNMNGLQKQAMLGVQGIQALAAEIDASSMGYMMPNCSYMYPPSLEQAGAQQFVMAAYYIEATLCGTFIGLADYVQTPESAFLMARLSAEHGIHASFLGSYMNPTPFSSMSMALTPAFTPQEVLTSGSGMPNKMNVGHLGKYVPSSCAPVPQAPCGGSVMIGNLTAQLLGGESVAMSSMSATATGNATMPYAGSMGMSSMNATATATIPYVGMNGSSAATNTSVAGPSYTGPTQITNAAPRGGVSRRWLGGIVGGAALALL